MYVRTDRTARRRSLCAHPSQTTPACSRDIATARLRHIPCFTRDIMKDPRILELVLGRMLDLVVFSVEGVRDRFSRGRLLGQ